MSIASAILDHYDLRDNPFDHRFKDPLSDNDVALYARVEGFGRQVPPLESWFTRSSNLAQPACFLVHGPRGCGRSSVVRFIIALFAAAKRQADSQAQIGMVSAASQDADDIRPVLDLLSDLYNQIQAGTMELNVNVELLKDYEQYVLGEDTSLRRLASIFARSMVFLRAKQYHAAIVLENIEKYKQIVSLRTVFKEAPLIIVSTADDQISKDFGNAETNGMVVDLGQLTFQDIVDFVSQRWAAVSRTHPPRAQHPFEMNGLRRVFEAKPAWEFKGVVGLLTEIFDRHVDALQSAQPLPPAPVAMQQDEMFRWAYEYVVRRGI